MRGRSNYSHIIWDWNGTLFDDVNWCIMVINEMLSKRGLKQLNCISEYHDVFCFPILDYYKNVGFNFEKESFEELAKEYIALYHSEKGSIHCKLHTNALFVLKTLQEKNKFQIILSASESNNLLSQMNLFDIILFFDKILGLSNIYAESKISIGKNYILQNEISNAVLIGDTEHDYEVSKALKVDCLLIANGHQRKDKLQLCKVPVLDNISDVFEFIE